MDVVPGGWLHRVAGTAGGGRVLAVNSLHFQAIDRLATGLAVEATASDGTIEAVRVTTAAGFAVGVQWHPEYDWEHDAVSRAIFFAFGAAASAVRRGAEAAAD